VQQFKRYGAEKKLTQTLIYYRPPT